jgi:hypothetical protein
LLGAGARADEDAVAGAASLRGLIEPRLVRTLQPDGVGRDTIFEAIGRKLADLVDVLFATVGLAIRDEKDDGSLIGISGVSDGNDDLTVAANAVVAGAVTLRSIIAAPNRVSAMSEPNVGAKARRRCAQGLRFERSRDGASRCDVRTMAATMAGCTTVHHAQQIAWKDRARTRFAVAVGAGGIGSSGARAWPPGRCVAGAPQPTLTDPV